MLICLRGLAKSTNGDEKNSLRCFSMQRKSTRSRKLFPAFAAPMMRSLARSEYIRFVKCGGLSKAAGAHAGKAGRISDLMVFLLRERMVAVAFVNVFRLL